MTSRVVVHPPVLPVRPGAPGAPTLKQARSQRWRRTSLGLVVPREAPQYVEQRIAEVASAVPRGGLVTGWAALRMYGARWFDGLGRDGATEVPVPLRIPHSSRQRPAGAQVRRCRRACGVRLVHGVALADPETATLDAMEQARSLREAVVVMDMAAAGQVTSRRRVRSRLAGDPRRRGRARILRALELSIEESASPPESRMRLVWLLDAELPTPRINVDVRDRFGGFVCRPDLLDVESGTMGEYDGEGHRTRAQHRADEARLDRARAVGLERFTVVAGDSVETQVARMRAARERALWLPAPQRAWVVAPSQGPALDEVLRARDAPPAS